jgi:hypothetical protein
MRIQREVGSEVSSCFHYGENHRGRENVELSSTKDTCPSQPVVTGILGTFHIGGDGTG